MCDRKRHNGPRHVREVLASLSKYYKDDNIVDLFKSLEKRNVKSITHR